MKRIKEIIGVLLLVTGIACTEDKGNYNYTPSSNIKYIDNQLVTVIKIQMICKCKYKTI